MKLSFTKLMLSRDTKGKINGVLSFIGTEVGLIGVV